MASAAMANLFAGLKESLTFDGPDIDTWVYKFYSRATVGIFFSAAAACVFSEIVGTAIKCKDKDETGYDETWCYLHGIEHLTPGKISQEMSGGNNCISTTEKISNYYLWIPLVLFLCGGAFTIPNEIWKHVEGGLIKQFEGLKIMELEKDTRKKLAEQFKNVSNHFTKRYFFTFVFFEVVYFFLGIVVFHLLDVFLDGKFKTYGQDVIDYINGNAQEYHYSIKDQQRSHKMTVNPMCNVFPTVVSCTITTYSVVGDAPDVKNKACILGQNIMNQGIFLILWFWFMILFCVTACQIIYRITTMLVPSFQETTIQYQLKTKDEDMLRAIKKLKLGFGNAGNWFLLTQIGGNADPYAFRMFIEEVSGVTRSAERVKKEEERKKKTKDDLCIHSSNGTELEEIEKGERKQSPN